ncbi:hypothetical protein ACMC9M_08505 [Pseudomonadota bacterium 24LQ007]
MKHIWIFVLATIAGCTFQETKEPAANIYSPFHKLFIDSPEAQVWVDSRFDLLAEHQNDQGKLWLYSDYQGQSDQEFIYIFAGRDDTIEWPPAENENTIELGSPIGTIYETYGGIEASYFAIPQLAEAFNFPYPACSHARILSHKSDGDRYLVMVYMEGASCAHVFGPKDSISVLTEITIKNQARSVLKLKER